MKDAVLAAVDRDHLVQWAVDLANIVSMTGEEQPLAEYLSSQFEALGMRVKYQEVEEGRSNVIAELRGTGRGATLMFCGHMDHFDTPEPTQVVGDRIYGRGLVNMKAAFPAYLGAVEALQKAQAPLEGNIIISCVVGEIEKAQVSGYHGKNYRGGGIGAAYMMDHGVTADLCIIGEPTGLQLQIGNAGYVLNQITIKGTTTNWVQKTFEVAQAIAEFEPDYQQRYKHPLMLPLLRVGALEGGYPFKPGILPVGKLYVVARTIPDTPPLEIQRILEGICARLQGEDPSFTWEVEPYMSTMGYEISKDEYVVKVIADAHQEVTGQEVPYPEPIRYSITSDGARITPFGVPTITYGPGFGTHLTDPTEPRQELAQAWDTAGGTRRGVGIQNLVTCTKVYALAALNTCSKTLEELHRSGALKSPG